MMLMLLRRQTRLQLGCHCIVKRSYLREVRHFDSFRVFFRKRVFKGQRPVSPNGQGFVRLVGRELLQEPFAQLGGFPRIERCRTRRMEICLGTGMRPRSFKTGLWLWISEEFRCIQIVLAGDADQERNKEWRCLRCTTSSIWNG